MTEFELLQDFNLLIQYEQQLRDTTDIKELNRIYSMTKKKLDEVYRDKKSIIKDNKKGMK